MSLPHRLYPKRALAALDVGHGNTTVLIAQKKDGDTFDVLGAGESVTRGFESGRIVHLGDAVETVAEALGKAQRGAGICPEALYYNFEDPQVDLARPSASQTLRGEGEISASDVEQACRAADRAVGDFEKSLIYSNPVGFVIDDRDRVSDPVGTFGRKLDVTVLMIRSGAERVESWKRMIERAYVPKGIPVLSALSTAFGILPKQDRKRRRLIADLGRDTFNFILFENGAIHDLRVMEAGPDPSVAVAVAAEMKSLHPGIEQFFITGDLAQETDWITAMNQSDGLQAQVAAPLGVPELSAPRYASCVGLLHAAEQRDKRLSAQLPDQGLWKSAKTKAQAFISEYF